MSSREGDAGRYSCVHHAQWWGRMHYANPMPDNCYRIESHTDRKGLSVQPFHEQQQVNTGRAAPRTAGAHPTSFACVWDHPPEKSAWEFERHASGGYLIKLKVWGWARFHGHGMEVFEDKGYLAVADDHPLDHQDPLYYVHITNDKACAAIWRLD